MAQVPLTCLSALRERWAAQKVVCLAYQLEAAARIIDEMDGQGILADEVGLGKTIEAGLVMSELMRRGRCRSVLILCPAPLCHQWHGELAQKFGLSFAVDPSGLDWSERDLLIASLDAAKRETARTALEGRTWDLVVVDEAHRLKNRQTQNHRLVATLRRRRLLLLSATPLQNDLTELYALVSLVRPGLFGNFHAFWREFLLDRRTPRDPAGLRRVLAKVMVRHRRTDLRSELGSVLPQRQVSLLPLELLAQERQLYEAVTAAVRQEYWRRMRAAGAILPLITLQREVCSSAAAVRRTLARMDGGAWSTGALADLRTLADGVQRQAKAVTLGRLLGQLAERALVFTEFRATQEDLAAFLQGMGMEVLCFHGEQSAAERDAVLRRFAGAAQAILISTECGGQGLNLQCCRHIVNYDLPWNPMRVEQRIGRVHRLGQQRDVFIYNLYASNTIEEHLLRLLDEKINLFRQVVGELDVILRRLEDGGRRSLEGRIAEIIWQSEDERALSFGFDELGRQWLRQRRLARDREDVLSAASASTAADDAAPAVVAAADAGG